MTKSHQAFQFLPPTKKILLLFSFLPTAIKKKQYPELEPAFVEYFTPIELDMWLVCHCELHTSKKVRLVFDFLSEKLGFS
jgi:hypothetical protein